MKCIVQYDTKDLKTISRVLPYREVVEGLSSNYYSTDSDKMRVLLIEGISEVILEYFPKLNAVNNFYHSALQEARNKEVANAVRRSEELLRKYLKDKNEIVSYYAAKGIWEYDRTAAVSQLKKLSRSNNTLVVSMVKDLIEEWGIE